MKKLLSLLLCALLITGLLAGCGSSAGDMPRPQDNKSEQAFPEGEQAAGDLTDSGTSLQTLPDHGRKLVRTVNMEAESRSYDELMTGLTQKIADLGGYIENREANNQGSVGNRSCSMTIRIPADQLHSFLTHVNVSANVLYTSESTEDVTLRYVDTESRVNALRTEQARLNELLAQASDVAEILQIEERLSQVSYELESYASQLRTYDNLVDYATVHLSLYEVQELTPVDPPSIWQRISSGSRQTWKDLVSGSGDVFVWVIVNLPYLVLVGLVILGVHALNRRRRVRKARRKAEKAEKAALAEKPAEEENPQ